MDSYYRILLTCFWALTILSPVFAWAAMFNVAILCALWAILVFIMYLIFTDRGE